MFDAHFGRDSNLQFVFASHAAEVPDKCWCSFEGIEHSYAEIDADANRVAHALIDVGVARGDRVAVYMDNCVEYFVIMFAIHRVGAVYVPCSTHYSADELEYQLSHSGAAVVFVDGAHRATLDQARQTCAAVTTVIVVGADTGGADVDLATLLEQGSPEMPSVAAQVTASELAMIMYTSGTTARPKGVMFSHGNLRTAALTAVTHFRWTKNDRFLHYFPLFHANGGLYGVFPALMSQASIMMVPKFSASAFGSQLHDLGITFTSVNATHVKMIMNHPVSPRDAEHQTWRMMLGLTLRPDEITAFENRFATRLCPTYGLTEGLGIDAIGEPVGPRRVGSAGRLLRGYKLRVVDESGTELPAGERGEAEFASELEHGVPMGYFRDPEKTAEIYRDGWVRTGDVLEMDADGYLWFVERKRDMIKRSGYNVAPAEVERVIAAVAGVADVAVVGAPDEMREEAIIAYVVADAGAVVTPELVLAACTTTLADYKVPQVVEIIDALPRNFLGKIERKVLRERALEHRVVATARPVSGA